ncbi:hypothetical protein [Euzebya tangerina]|uniref:hypothetical protein n=1 Tax=Euzebya tangerina TaxID=591198 RepID=UPI00196AC814|nr:hypothetical protein [Euzebya tangerina]
MRPTAFWSGVLRSVIVVTGVLALLSGCADQRTTDVGVQDAEDAREAPPVTRPATGDDLAPVCDELQQYRPEPAAMRTAEPVGPEDGVPTPGPELWDLTFEGGREEVLAWARERAPDTYAGMWLDDSATGPLVVAFAEDVEAIQQDLVERFDGPVSAVQVPHRAADLAEVERQFRGQVTPPANPPEPSTILSVSRRDQYNRVFVGLLGDDTDLRRQWAADFGDRICVEITPIPSAETADAQPWSLEPDADITPTTTSFVALLAEQGCHGSEPTPPERIVPPEVQVTDDAVIVTIAVIPPIGGQDCPGVPPAPVLVELPEPLGDRELLDGYTDPASPPAEPEITPAPPTGPQPIGTVTPSAIPQGTPTEVIPPGPQPTGTVTPAPLPAPVAS